jgi:hypothetical protein
MTKHIADVANADPVDIGVFLFLGVFLFQRLGDCATCYGDDQKRAHDDVYRARQFAANYRKSTSQSLREWAILNVRSGRIASVAEWRK